MPKRSARAQPTPAAPKERKRQPPRAKMPAPPALADVLAHEETMAEDELRAALDNLEDETERHLVSLLRTELPEQPEDKRTVRGANARQVLTEIRALRRALELRQLWTAAIHALMVGIRSGLDQAFPYEYHATRKLRLQEPDVVRGRKQVEAARRAGKESAAVRRHASERRVLREFDKLRAEHPTWTAARVAMRLAVKNRATGELYSKRHIERIVARRKAAAKPE